MVSQSVVRIRPCHTILRYVIWLGVIRTADWLITVTWLRNILLCFPRENITVMLTRGAFHQRTCRMFYPTKSVLSDSYHSNSQTHVLLSQSKPRKVSDLTTCQTTNVDETPPPPKNKCEDAHCKTFYFKNKEQKCNNFSFCFIFYFEIILLSFFFSLL